MAGGDGAPCNSNEFCASGPKYCFDNGQCGKGGGGKACPLDDSICKNGDKPKRTCVDQGQGYVCVAGGDGVDCSADKPGEKSTCQKLTDNKNRCVSYQVNNKPRYACAEPAAGQKSEGPCDSKTDCTLKSRGCAIVDQKAVCVKGGSGRGCSGSKACDYLLGGRRTPTPTPTPYIDPYGTPGPRPTVVDPFDPAKLDLAADVAAELAESDKEKSGEVQEAIDEFLEENLETSTPDNEASKEDTRPRIKSDLSLLEKSKSEIAKQGNFSRSSDAPLKIVVFHDMTCGMCTYAFRENIKQLEPAIADGRIELIAIDFPLGMAADSRYLANAYHCAAEQGAKYTLSMLQEFYATNKTEGVLNRVNQVITTLGLDREKFFACADSNRYANLIEREVKLGEKLGVEGTPHFFYNGHSSPGAAEPENFRATVNAWLKIAGRQPL